MDYDKLLRKKYSGHKHCAKVRGIESTLTLEEYESLIDEAGITPEDIGRRSGEHYQLARYNDAGSYEIGNCRFVTFAENLKERSAAFWRKFNKSTYSKEWVEITDGESYKAIRTTEQIPEGWRLRYGK